MKTLLDYMAAAAIPGQHRTPNSRFMKYASYASLIIGLGLCLNAHAQDGKKRVFITDSQSWQVTGSAGGSKGNFGAYSSGGARPQTAEIYKTFGKLCPGVIVTNMHNKADYIVTLDHEGGKGYLRKDTKVAVFGKDGDMIFSKSTRSVGGAVEGACKAITGDK
jgi:hypothetical protein